MFLTTDHTDNTDFTNKVTARGWLEAGASDPTWRCPVDFGVFCVPCVFVYRRQVLCRRYLLPATKTQKRAVLHPNLWVTRVVKRSARVQQTGAGTFMGGPENRTPDILEGKHLPNAAAKGGGPCYEHEIACRRGHK